MSTEPEKCIWCGRAVEDKENAVYVARSDFYEAGAEGYVCRDCWCNNEFPLGCSGDCPECPLMYYCWNWCKKQ